MRTLCLSLPLLVDGRVRMAPELIPPPLRSLEIEADFHPVPLSRFSRGSKSDEREMHSTLKPQIFIQENHTRRPSSS